MVREHYKDVAVDVDGNRDFEAVYKDIRQTLKRIQAEVKLASPDQAIEAGTGPLRVLIAGAPAAGKGTQCFNIQARARLQGSSSGRQRSSSGRQRRACSRRLSQAGHLVGSGKSCPWGQMSHLGWLARVPVKIGLPGSNSVACRWRPAHSSLLSPPPTHTQAEASGCRVSQETFGILHLSCGDILRAEVKRGSMIGRRAKSYIDNGDPVPDDTVVAIIRMRLQQPDARARGWLLDGFPLNAAQAGALALAGIEPEVFIELQARCASRTQTLRAPLSHTHAHAQTHAHTRQLI